ncbi:hypothetical protein CHU98_g6786 [Xylaria longipes]|nr:hypothetical protein CHU98_g6786 [Xylaria longipes]
MAHKGARYIAISSRNPKIDERWLEKMQSMGVSVKVVANDITNRDSVQAVYREITGEMPAIAGVAQGAMVLHDTMFLDLDMDRLNKVLKPKVDGATYLEEIFRDTDLDFFVFFSSMASVTGNPGQSAYAAANMFMSCLANRRRGRGRNASAVHIGAIFGNGYVTRELTLTQQEFLRKVGNLWLSEHDFRQLFAEAILAGQHHRGKTPELSTGLKMVDSDESETITWFRNPMFQHCVNNTQTAELVNDGSRQNSPVKVQLIDAVSPSEVYEIISASLISTYNTVMLVWEWWTWAPEVEPEMLGNDKPNPNYNLDPDQSRWPTGLRWGKWSLAAFLFGTAISFPYNTKLPSWPLRLIDWGFSWLGVLKHAVNQRLRGIMTVFLGAIQTLTYTACWIWDLGDADAESVWVILNTYLTRAHDILSGMAMTQTGTNIYVNIACSGCGGSATIIGMVLKTQMAHSVSHFVIRSS